MKALLEAIYSKYDLTGMGLYLHQARTGADLPYCIYYLINSAPDYNFNAVTEDIEIQFSIFADSASEAMTQGDLLMALYDDCSLSVSGYEWVGMERLLTSLTKTNDVYQYVITYQVLIHKNI